MALGTVTVTSASDALKRLYSPNDVKELIYKKSPFLGMIPKESMEFEGDSFNFAVQYGSQQGVAGNYSSAAANQSGNLYKQFRLTRSKQYGKGTIDGEMMLASASKGGAFIRGLAQEQKGLLSTMGNRMSAHVFRNGGGALAQIATGGISGAVITLAVPAHSRFFQQDQTLELSTTDGTTGATKAGTVTVLSVDRALGKITCTASVTAGIATAAAGDYIFVRGDHATQYGIKNLVGLAAWIPVTAPTAGDSFFAVDRSNDPTRLAGQRFTGGGAPIEETLQSALGQWSIEDCNPDTILMHTRDFQNLITSLGSKVVYDTRSASDAKIGFKGVRISTPTGDAMVFGDANCTPGIAYGIDLTTWKLLRLGSEYPFLVGSQKGQDGLTVRRDPSSDGWMFEYAGYGQLACDAPGKNGVISL